MKPTTLAFVLLIAACVSACYVWDSFDAINRLDPITVGVTTKEEVIKRLGKPDFEDPTGRLIKYTGVDRSRSFGWCAWGGCAEFWEGPYAWQVAIRFDGNNVVVDIDTYTDYLHGVPNSIGLGKQAGVYCPNADLGHADAQLQIGDIFYHGKYSQKVDPVRAWVWYTLAVQNGDEAAKTRISSLTDELTPEQLEEAKRQLAAWKPGQCMQELTSDQKGQDAK